MAAGSVSTLPTVVRGEVAELDGTHISCYKAALLLLSCALARGLLELGQQPGGWEG